MIYFVCMYCRIAPFDIFRTDAGVYTDTQAYLDWIEDTIATVDAYKPLLTCFPSTLDGNLAQLEDLELARSTPLNLHGECVGDGSTGAQNSFNVRDDCVLLRDPCAA